VPNRWFGLVLTALIVGGIAFFLWANRDTTRRSGPEPPVVRPDFREYPIGDDERNALRIAAVWLPSVRVEGQAVVAGTDVIHLEADVHALADNPNGFAKDEFVPYLQIAYEISPAAGGPPLTGSLMPMVAQDGLHYGATVRMPGRGAYRLSYAIEPPSANGLGRHTDPVTGVAPWWEPFTVSFPWDYQPGTATTPDPAARR
jgi:uncharacterized protein involved in high-affinity Fe2+ transport